jgi:hypothetical protein
MKLLVAADGQRAMQQDIPGLIHTRDAADHEPRADSLAEDGEFVPVLE